MSILPMNYKRSTLITARTSQVSSEERKNSSLLSFKYTTFCPLAVISYIALQFIIGFHCIPVQIDYDTIDSLKVRFFTFGVGLAFTISVIQELSKVYHCKQSGGKKDLQGLHCSIAIMSGIAASSSFLKCAGNLGVMQDIFGVYSHTSQWAEWLITVPMMVFIALAIEWKPRLTRDDSIILSVFIIAIIFGFLLHIDGLSVELGYVMFVLGTCGLTIKKVVDRYHKAAPILPSDHHDHLSIASKKIACFRLFIILFPLFPLTHILGQCKVLDRDNTLIAYETLSLIAKLLFAGDLSTAYVNITDIEDKVIYC
jgi:hypothetical protein